MFHGFQGEFRWIESVSHKIEDVLRICPEVAIGKSWAVTAFDKEKLAAVLNDNLQSWQVSGSALLIPPLADLSQAPYNVFSEWYTFSGAVPQHKFHTFIRHHWFSLGRLLWALLRPIPAGTLGACSASSGRKWKQPPPKATSVHARG